MSSRKDKVSVESSDTNAWKHSASNTEQDGSAASESARLRVAVLLAAFVPCPTKIGMQSDCEELAILVSREGPRNGGMPFCARDWIFYVDRAVTSILKQLSDKLLRFPVLEKACVEKKDMI